MYFGALFPPLCPWQSFATAHAASPISFILIEETESCSLLASSISFTSLSLSVSSFVKRGNDCPHLQDVWDDKRNSAAWSIVTSGEPAAVAEHGYSSQAKLRVAKADTL